MKIIHFYKINRITKKNITNLLVRKEKKALPINLRCHIEHVMNCFTYFNPKLRNMKWTFIKTLIYNKRVSNLNFNYKRLTFIVSIVYFRSRFKFARYKILSWPDF